MSSVARKKNQGLCTFAKASFPILLTVLIEHMLVVRNIHNVKYQIHTLVNDVNEHPLFGEYHTLHIKKQHAAAVNDYIHYLIISYLLTCSSCCISLEKQH